jgi:hypothetical protein
MAAVGPPVINLAASDFASAFRSEAKAKALLKTFVNGLGNNFPWQRSSAALYLPTTKPHILVGSDGAILPEGLSWNAYPPGTLSLREMDSLQSWAWWGDIQAEIAEPGEPTPGFLPGERAVVVLPIRPPNREDGSPWGLIRLGMHADSDVANDVLAQIIGSEAFDKGMLAVLGAISQRGDDNAAYH